MTPPQKMLVGVSLGAAGGLAANLVASGQPWLDVAVRYVAEPAGQIFLRLLFVLVVPLVFSALVVGVGALELRSLGRIAGKTMAYTVVVSALAVLIGLTTVNVLQPGAGASDALRARAMESRAPAQAVAAPEELSPVALIVGIFPRNPIEAAANGDMLGWITFALLFGVGLVLTQGPGADALRAAMSGLYDVCMRLVHMVLALAPYGVGALLFSMTARLGLEVLGQLAAYVGVVVLALALHMVVVYSLSVRFLGGRNPLTFFSDIRVALLTAFSTASSSATLPTALEVAEHNLKLPPRVARFVLTAGSTMNQNGSALFEGVTVLFLAQLFEVPLGLGQQVVVMIICVLAGIGTAGVPSGSIPVIAMILGMFHIPPEGLGLILGVDRLLDMCRTTLNVAGDLAAAVFVARGEPDEPVADPPAPT